jgi:hypothetical protein
MEVQKEENSEEKENNYKNNNDNNSDNDLFLKQEKEIIDNYNERENKIKNAFESMYERFLQNHTFYESFIYLIKDYKESKLKNIDSLTNILNKYFPNNDNNINKSENGQINTIKNEFKEIINMQIIAEKEKINEIYLDDKYKKIEDDLKKSRELMDELNNLYNSYISSLNKIKEAQLIYIKLFYNYEKKLIDIANKSMKIKHLNNNESDHNNELNNCNININYFTSDEKEQNEFNSITKELMKKEKQYRKLVQNYDDNINPKYSEFKKCIDDLSIYHNDFNEQENKIFTFIYLGYVISIESQHKYQKKDLNFANLASINYQNYKELKHLFENLSFEKYKTILISSNKIDNHICKDITPEIMIKLSKIINLFFPYISKLEKGEYEEPNIKFIHFITQKLISENCITKEEEYNLINIFKEQKYRLEFLQSLNYFRSKGKFIVSAQNLIMLGNAIRTIADLFDVNNKDYDILNLLIIMSQTYYALNYKKKKIYLIRFIDDHDLFQSEEIWEFYINESIKKELEEASKRKTEEEELDEEAQNSKFGNIYFTVLLSITQNILEFQIDKVIIMKIMTNLIDKKYKIIPEYIEQILCLIDETVYEKRNKLDVNTDILGKRKSKFF